MKKPLGYSMRNNTILIGLHIAFFAGAMLLKYTLNPAQEDYWIHLFCAPKDFTILMHQPWSAITHLFIHLHPLHLLFNVGVLSLLLSTLTMHLGSRWVWLVYITGGLSGYLAFGMIPTIGTSRIQYITGSSAALTALISAGMFRYPQLKIHIGGNFYIDLKWLALIILSIDLWMIAGGKDMGTHGAHLGGAICGSVIGWMTRPNVRSSQRRMVRGRPKTDDEFNAERATRRQRVDALLEKISRSGFESLTVAEREYLERNSKDL
jgi:membrane associated rhomboid family serine protease